ncbi:MAG: hypothetical protein K1000chlam2_01327 [Chlamydiae bacterium]|nr:hypothetical protein [Chlamydiota bacterium]
MLYLHSVKNLGFMMVSGYIHTLGDSTLDNLYWMLQNFDIKDAKLHSVEGVLQTLADGYKVVSHAYDGFTTQSVLEGDRIGEVLPSGPTKDSYMRERKGSQVVHPLADLEQNVSKAANTPHYIVISVGGNDFRANFQNPWRLLKDIPEIQKRYLQIVEKVRSIPGRNVQPILVLQYRTDANHDPYLIYPLLGIIGVVAMMFHVTCLALLTAPVWIIAGKISIWKGGLAFLTGAVGLHLSRKSIPLSVTKDVFLGKKISMVTLGALMQSFYQPILEQAKKDRIPVLDLSNTFHPYRKLYEHGIEPSQEGGKLIAEGIYHILKHHDFRSESMLYSKSSKNSIYTGVTNKNPSAWRVAYPH